MLEAEKHIWKSDSYILMRLPWAVRSSTSIGRNASTGGRAIRAIRAFRQCTHLETHQRQNEERDAGGLQADLPCPCQTERRAVYLSRATQDRADFVVRRLGDLGMAEAVIRAYRSIKKSTNNMHVKQLATAWMHGMQWLQESL